ncbi:MAG: SRPBCC domain-containing protein [Gaiellaceae bacterium]
MNQQASETVIQKAVTVARPVEQAFRVFTEEIGTWWPLHTHAVDTENAKTAIMEGRVGGRLFERTSTGKEHVWGTIATWEPPHRVVYSWHPDREEETDQEVEVTFTPDGDGTRVEVRHYGWEKLGARMAEMMGGYDEGWDLVIGHYADTANAGRSG